MLSTKKFISEVTARQVFKVYIERKRIVDEIINLTKDDLHEFIKETRIRIADHELMHKIELEEDELDFHHNTKIDEIYSPNMTQLLNIFNRITNELSIETSIFSIADILMSECLWQKGKEKELDDYLECIKGLERYKER